jgi:hypothetical protein
MIDAASKGAAARLRSMAALSWNEVEGGFVASSAAVVGLRQQIYRGHAIAASVPLASKRAGA